MGMCFRLLCRKGSKAKQHSNKEEAPRKRSRKHSMASPGEDRLGNNKEGSSRHGVAVDSGMGVMVGAAYATSLLNESGGDGSTHGGATGGGGHGDGGGCGGGL